MSRRKLRQRDTVVLSSVRSMAEPHTLIEEVEALIEQLQRRADRLYWMCHRQKPYMHWIVRGQVGVVQRVVRQLLAIHRQHTTSYALYLALKDYLGCLEKCSVDAKDEQRPSASSHGSPILRWKAIGEARELPTISRAITHITEAHAPSIVCHTLALDGYTLLPDQSLMSDRDADVRTYRCTHDDGEG